MTRLIQFGSDEFYHVYNRGTEKRIIFLSDKDYERFLVLLYTCNGTVPVDLKLQGQTLDEVRDINRGEKLVDICTYCLMPNHFHLILREVAGGGISKFMQKLTTAYTMYFNKKYDRSGALFQGTFKATHADDDAYLSYLIAYIHLNPIKIIDPFWKERGIQDKLAAEKFLNNFSHSSFVDYRGDIRIENMILSMDALPKYFETPKDFITITTTWLDYNTSKILQG